MKSFETFLVEGRDAPLYHATSIISAESILRTDTFRPGRKPDPVPGQVIKQQTTSFTRDIRFAINWYDAEVIFEINQTKLAQNYKLIPSNYWAGDRINALQNPKQNVARPQKHTSKWGSKPEVEFEEIVVGPVYNAAKYILKVMLTKEAEFRIIHGDQLYYENLQNSALLWSLTRNDWI